MPTYVYKFIETGETVEVQQSFSDPTLTEYAHPETGATMPVNQNDVSWLIGVSYRFSPRFGIMGRYTRGITPLLNPEKNGLNRQRLLTYLLTLRLEYYFK